ncbi:hypothetical protein PybrP1_009515 [[Pythium] brassicae (nom. inval.)]|nr:hypothetical protein PybrP1_009515 [[Pythium] brassicae (nom. inval.)]
MQQSTGTPSKNTRTISRQELEKAVGAIISRSSSLRQRMLRVKKAVEKEVDEVDQYSLEIDECLERIDEIEAFCKEVRRDRAAVAKHGAGAAGAAAQLDIESELEELLVEREEETQLLTRMMQTREMHAEAHRKLMLHFAALHREWLHVKKQQRALAMVLLRISLVRIARRKQLI